MILSQNKSFKIHFWQGIGTLVFVQITEGEYLSD